MGEEISPQSSPEKQARVIHISSSSSDDSDGTPIRSILCLKRNMDLKDLEDTEDCFILDFNPFESLHFSKLSVSEDHSDSPDIFVIAQRGQVACRDYPHSRHLCAKFPFETTSHESYCQLCYCYVCDLAAPCKYWTQPQTGHCHATEHIDDWKSRRELKRQALAVHK